MLLALIFNTFSGNGQMERMAGLSNGGMVEWRRATQMAGMSTYLLF
jgi:hypothetical protein